MNPGKSKVVIMASGLPYGFGSACPGAGDEKKLRFPLDFDWEQF